MWLGFTAIALAMVGGTFVLKGLLSDPQIDVGWFALGIAFVGAGAACAYY